MKLSQVMETLQAGKMVANPEAWKKGTVNVNSLMVVISGIVAILNFFECSWCNIQLSTEQVIGLATGIVSIGGLFNAGSTIITTDKIGIGRNEKGKIRIIDNRLIDDINKNTK